MTNTVQNKYKEHILADLLMSTVKLVLVDGADHVHDGTEEFLSDVDSSARVAISAALTSKTVTNGQFNGTTTGFASATGDESEQVYLFIDTGTDTTSRLICHWDTSAGFPIDPDGNNISVSFPDGYAFAV